MLAEIYVVAYIFDGRKMRVECKIKPDISCF